MIHNIIPALVVQFARIVDELLMSLNIRIHFRRQSSNGTHSLGLANDCPDNLHFLGTVMCMEQEVICGIQHATHGCITRAERICSQVLLEPGGGPEGP